MVPAAWHDGLTQEAVIVKGSQAPAVTADFAAFVRSPQGRAILTQYGIQPVGSK